MKDNRNIGMKKEMEDTLMDICLELKDEGFTCVFNRSDYGDITIFRDNGDLNSQEEFDYDEVSDVVDRISDFISDIDDYEVKIIKTNHTRKYRRRSIFERIREYLSPETGDKVEFVRVKFRNLRIEKMLDDIINELDNPKKLKTFDLVPNDGFSGYQTL